MSKPYVLEATESAIGIFVEATHTIRYGGETHPTGSVMAVSPRDADELIAAGVAQRAAPGSPPNVPIEEQLPGGLDPRVWRADPRLKTIGQKPSNFVLIADFEEQYPRGIR